MVRGTMSNDFEFPFVQQRQTFCDVKLVKGSPGTLPKIQREDFYNSPCE